MSSEGYIWETYKRSSSPTKRSQNLGLKVSLYRPVGGHFETRGRCEEDQVYEDFKQGLQKHPERFVVVGVQGTMKMMLSGNLVMTSK